MDIPVGATAEVGLTVAEPDTAVALGSGDVAVLGTPRVLALLEQATVAATAAGLADGETSVGTRIELDHLAATPIGRTVLARATLLERDGRRLVFEVSLRDGSTVAAQGRVERVVVDRGRFLDRALADPAPKG